MCFFTKYKMLCEEKGIGVSIAAEKMGFARSATTRWRNGSTPDMKTINTIADFFGVSADYLLGNTEIRNPAENKSPEEIAKVALFGGEKEVTDEMWNEVKDYVEYIKAKHFKS